MKRRITLIYILTTLFSAIIIAVLPTNVISTYQLASGQTEEMGRMRIEIIASDMQETLSEATHSLDRIGTNFEQILADGADNDEIRSCLSEEKRRRSPTRAEPVSTSSVSTSSASPTPATSSSLICRRLKTTSFRTGYGIRV